DVRARRNAPEEAATLRGERGEPGEHRRREDPSPRDRDCPVHAPARASAPDDAAVPRIEGEHPARVVAEVEPVAYERGAGRYLHAAVEDPARPVRVEVEGVDIPVRRAEVRDSVPDDGRGLGQPGVVAPAKLSGLERAHRHVAGLHRGRDEDAALGIDGRRRRYERADVALPQDTTVA